MSEADDGLAISTRGARLMSLSVRLQKTETELKRLYHNTRNAPEALKSLAHGIETVSLDLKLIERHGPIGTYGADLLDRCLERCEEHSASIEQLTDQISRNLDDVFLSGKLDGAFQERGLPTLLYDLDRTQTALQQVILDFHGEEQNRRFLVRAAGVQRSNRGHDYSNIAVSNYARAHFGDAIYHGNVYITHCDPSSQQTIATLETSAHVLQRRTGERERAFQESGDEPYQMNEQSTDMQRIIQTHTDDLKRELSLVVKQTRENLVRQLEESSPLLIVSNQSIDSSEMVQGPTRRKRGPKNTSEPVSFRLKLRVPLWFSYRVWEITRVDATAGWDLHFRTYNQRPYHAMIFEYCREGDFESVKRLIQNGEASLSDVTELGENLLQVTSYCRGIPSLDLVRWLIEQNVTVGGDELIIFLSTYLMTAAEVPQISGDLLRMFVDEVDEPDGDVTPWAFIQMWMDCRSSIPLDVLLHKFGRYPDGLSVEGRAKFVGHILNHNDSADVYMAKINLCRGAPSLDLFYRIHATKLLQDVVFAIRREVERGGTDSDLEPWAHIGITAINNGADLFALKGSFRQRLCTPLLTLFGLSEWFDSVNRNSIKTLIGRISRCLRLWKAMLEDANVDLSRYSVTETRTWRSIKPDTALRCPISRDTVLRLVALDHDTHTQRCSLRVQLEISIPLVRLHRLPGSFPCRTEVPHIICWLPNRKEVEEGHWIQSESRVISLRGRVMDLQEFEREYDGSYDHRLVDSTQDDNGILMRMIDMSYHIPRSRKRSSSQPVPSDRRRYDHGTVHFSHVHRWLPPVHFCTDRSAWSISDHIDGVNGSDEFVDIRRCVDSDDTMDRPWYFPAFISDIYSCQTGDIWFLRHHKGFHDGTRQCLEGCGKVDLSKISVPDSLPSWHPGFFFDSEF